MHKITYIIEVFCSKGQCNKVQFWLIRSVLEAYKCTCSKLVEIVILCIILMTGLVQTS